MVCTVRYFISTDFEKNPEDNGFVHIERWRSLYVVKFQPRDMYVDCNIVLKYNVIYSCASYFHENENDATDEMN
jgi:hypothetical protein